jgi:GT2 family glycosyltransferase
VSNVTSLSVGVVTFRSEPSVLEATFSSLAAALMAAAGQAVATKLFVIINDPERDAVDGIKPIVYRAMAPVAESTVIEIIAGHGNVGYGAAHNLAIRRSDADVHLVLNPDVSLDPCAISASLEYLAAHSDTAIVVARGYDAFGRYAYLAKRMPTVLALGLRGLGLRPSDSWLGRRVAAYMYHDLLPSETAVAVELASGCFMCCRGEPLRAVGGFDERYFLYFEDYDLSQRTRQYGKIIEIPDARIIHLGGRTVSRGVRRIMWFCLSGVRFFIRHGWRFW